METGLESGLRKSVGKEKAERDSDLLRYPVGGAASSGTQRTETHGVTNGARLNE